ASMQDASVHGGDGDSGAAETPPTKKPTHSAVDSGTSTPTTKPDSPTVKPDAGTGAAEPTCGDGSVDDGEECDDGNDVDDDDCTTHCTLPVCGDGVRQKSEQCDDGNGKNNDDCANDCTTDQCLLENGCVADTVPVSGGMLCAGDNCIAVPAGALSAPVTV